MGKARQKPLYLYNTMQREKVEFTAGEEVGLYTCGPTVYGYAHIGNLRTYVFEDILKRVLLYNGYKIKHVMNITDVGHLTDDADLGDDKMEESAAREGSSAWSIAEKYTQAFQNDIKTLNILEPDIWCKATDHIQEQIDLVKKLEEKGIAYRIEDGIYFDTSKFSAYGDLAMLKMENLDAGKRVKLAEGKKNPTDFALWKFSPADKKRQMEWDSPWGMGFPGWHIECSAMSVKYLGEQFDIHCGGIDHVPVHHTNEIAQVEAVTGKPWVRYWLHGEFLLTPKADQDKEGEKMAKSEGNILTLQVLAKQGYNPLAYRYFLLNAHYRKQLLFRDDVIKSAQNGFNNLCRRVADLQEQLSEKPGKMTAEQKKANKHYRQTFQYAINDDLNMPQALASTWDMLHDKTLPPHIALNLMENFDQVLGLDIFTQASHKLDLPGEIQDLLTQRQKAREQKNWQESDRLRDLIKDAGYEVLDGKQGAKIRKI